MTDTAVNPETVPLGLLRRYLRRQGWRRVTHANSTPRPPPKYPAALQTIRPPPAQTSFDIWELNEWADEPIPVIVPTNSNSPEYRERVERTVKTLATVEQRTPEQVAVSIRSFGFDLVCSRVPDALVLDDSVQLEIAANYMAGIRDLLTAAANTEIEPTLFYPRAVPKAVKYADSCRFGHTFRGSFGFTVESPLEENTEPPMNFFGETPPFERLVVQRLARGVKAACDAVDTGDIGALIENVKSGFGANAYEKFAQLIEDTSPGGLKISFSFSPEWRTAPELSERVEFLVDQRHVEVSRRAAKAMMAKPAARPETIIGSISDLHSDDPQHLMDTNSGRRITVRWFNGAREVNVLIPLEPEDYKRASDAHITGRQIRASGTLEQQGRSLVLLYVMDLTIEEPAA
jgi:hypothetical protein